uniref:MULE transposase domain-containing protein n=1 Tax=Phytophthora ramorum TaxID=164328 RepID=H3GKY8_PHYRM
MSEAEAITPFKATIHWKGFQLTKYHGSNKKTTYQCSYYRRGCKAKIDVMTDGRVLEIRFPHSCNGEVIVISSDDSSSGESPLASRRPPPQDVTQQIDDETDALALQQVAAPPSQIWDQVREQFTINEMKRGLSRDQVISRVYRARRVHFGGSVHGHVEVPPLSQARDGSNFFQFNYSYAGETRAERVVGWGHPVLIRLLTYADVSLFVDGTFYCVPSAFYQCVIMMVYDRGSRCYVPVMWVLNTCKTEWIYWHVLHCVQVATCMNMSPGTISCDFEQALINAVGDQFPDSTITGCLFHFKQAIRRRMIKLHISTDKFR